MQCGYCGKFRKPEDLKGYIPFGNLSDLEPRDTEFICNVCYDKMKPQELLGFLGVCWVKPYSLVARGESQCLEK